MFLEWILTRMNKLAMIPGGLFLEPEAAKYYWLMVQAAAADGVALIPSGPRAAWRSKAMQASLVVERPTFAAPVGKSKHELGLAIDIDLIDDATGKERPAKAWLERNSGRFYFYSSIAREPWHFEFVKGKA